MKFINKFIKGCLAVMICANLTFFTACGQLSPSEESGENETPNTGETPANPDTGSTLDTGDTGNETEEESLALVKESDGKAYCLATDNVLTLNKESAYKKAYVGENEVGTVDGVTVTLNPENFTLGESYHLTLVDESGNTQTLGAFKYVTATLACEQDLIDNFSFNNGNGAIGNGYYVLTADITSWQYYWRARGGNTFAGTLDGQGHTIDGMVFANGMLNAETKNERYSAHGLFYILSDGAVIKNIAMTNITANIGSSGAFACMVDLYATATIENVYVSYAANQDLSTLHAIGGLIGAFEQTGSRLVAKNCVVSMPLAVGAAGTVGGTHGLLVGTTGRYDKEVTVTAENCTLIGGNQRINGLRVDYNTAHNNQADSINDLLVLEETNMLLVQNAFSVTDDHKLNWSQMQKDAFAKTQSI